VRRELCESCQQHPAVELVTIAPGVEPFAVCAGCATPPVAGEARLMLVSS
jgi:protein-arginine kinase activator protein McsA